MQQHGEWLSATQLGRAQKFPVKQVQSSWNLWILLPVIFARYFCQKHVYIIRWSGGEFKVITVWRSLGRLSPNVHVMSDFYNLSQYFKTSWCKSLSLKAFRDGGFCLRAMQGDSAIPFAEPCVPLQKAELAEPLEQLEQMSASSAPWMEPADPAGARAALWLDNLKLWVKQHHRQWAATTCPTGCLTKIQTKELSMISGLFLREEYYMLCCLPPCCSSPIWQKTL